MSLLRIGRCRMPERTNVCMSEYETPDFETHVDAEGSLRVPASYVRKLGFEPGSRLSVRLTDASVAADLQARGIAQEEVDLIGSTQLEPRENVLEFLRAEGALAELPEAAARLRSWLRSGE